MKHGKVQIYCGNGKGKTTAAVGLAVRAAGRGLGVLFTQFLKNQDSGEIPVLKRIEEIQVFEGEPVKKFLWNMEKAEKEAVAQEHTARLLEVFRVAREKDLLVLDEILPAVCAGLVEEEQLLECLEQRPKTLEVVLTGREATPRLEAMADYISRVQEEKHPFRQGLPARCGIEF